MNSRAVGFRWLGTAGIELTFAGKTLVVDPFFTRPPIYNILFGRIASKAALAQQHIPRADAVLISHAHYDHLMDVPAVQKHTGAAAYGSANACQLLALHGIPAAQMHRIGVGDHLDLDPFCVEVLKSKHLRLPINISGALAPNLRPPLRLLDYRMDNEFSFLCTVNGLRVLNWCGEETFTPPAADILLMHPYGSSAYTSRLLAQVQPRLVIPNHWDDFFRPLSKPIIPTLLPPRLRIPPTRRVRLGDLERLVTGAVPGCRFFVPEIFKMYELEKLLEG